MAAIALLGAGGKMGHRLARNLKGSPHELRPIAVSPAGLARLAELGLQDDRAFAEGHVRRRSRSLGPLALSAELVARGIDRRLADGAMVQFTRDEQLASATGVAERLCGRKSFPTYRALLDTVGSKLLRRGFSMTVARAACEAVWRGAGD